MNKVKVNKATLEDGIPPELLDAIDRQLPEINSQGRRMVIGMDGMCGSGKTTLARVLGEKYGVPVIHMDDFYLPVELRTDERRGEPGGNVHYERFCEEALPFLGKRTSFQYGRFSDDILDIAEIVTIPDSPLLIVEGAYTLRPEFRHAYDLKVCVLCSPELQKKRLIQREGEEGYLEYRDMWIPLEVAYHKYYDTEKFCDMVLYEEGIPQMFQE